MTQHLHPLEPPFSEDIARLLARYPHRDGYLLSLFRTFANSRRFLEKGVANLLDRESPLSQRQREIIILRVTSNLNCEYEWGVHVTAFARAAGLSEAQVSATRRGRFDETCWASEEQVLLRAVDDLCAQGVVADETLSALEATWTLPQQLEILALVGNYHTVSFVANTARLPPEAFAARFPDPA